MIENTDSTIIVIFGGTGDLTKKKLFSALLDLYVKEKLPKAFKIVGFAREDFSHEEYRTFVKEAIEKKGHEHSEDKVNTFIGNFFYHKGDLLNIESYKDLGDCLSALKEGLGDCPNKLFYLAVPPSLYASIFDNLADSGLTIPCSNEEGWTRVLVEKPFGTDLHTAQELDRKLGELFKEEQIFRIDHYLAKNAIQNIVTFRFSNVLFENSWNRDYVERVHVKLYESRGIDGRGSFYSSTGALRDVGQNHMLQMLALIAMENPGEITSSTLQKARENVLSALRIYEKDELNENVIRAQYEGYKEVDGVGGGCDTETYSLVKAFIENSRWKDVPFYLESGKGLPRDLVQVEIHFKQLDKCICGDKGEHEHKNILTLTLQPEESVNMQFWIKKPGLEFQLESKDLSFVYKKEEGILLPDAYEKVLYDCIVGDQTLFVSTNEVEAAWKFIMNILENWNSLPLRSYKEGSEGPEEAKELLSN